MLPGKSSTPVSRQPIPRMWLSPSPRTLSQSPWRIRVRSRNASSGDRLSLSLNDSPSSSGQNVDGTTPLGLNITTSRFLRACPFAKPRLGRFMRNGKAAALIPRSRMNSRRVLRWATSSLLEKSDESDAGVRVRGSGRHGPRRRRSLSYHLSFRQGRRRPDFHDELTDVEMVPLEGLPKLGQPLGPEGVDRLLDQI